MSGIIGNKAIKLPVSNDATIDQNERESGGGVIRFNGSTDRIQFSHDGTTWHDMKDVTWRGVWVGTKNYKQGEFVIHTDGHVYEARNDIAGSQNKATPDNDATNWADRTGDGTQGPEGPRPVFCYKAVPIATSSFTTPVNISGTTNLTVPPSGFVYAPPSFVATSHKVIVSFSTWDPSARNGAGDFADWSPPIQFSGPPGADSSGQTIGSNAFTAKIGKGASFLSIPLGNYTANEWNEVNLPWPTNWVGDRLYGVQLIDADTGDRHLSIDIQKLGNFFATPRTAADEDTASDSSLDDAIVLPVPGDLSGEKSIYLKQTETTSKVIFFCGVDDFQGKTLEIFDIGISGNSQSGLFSNNDTEETIVAADHVHFVDVESGGNTTKFTTFANFKKALAIDTSFDGNLTAEKLVMNSDASGNPSSDVAIEVKRGNEDTVGFRWNEGTDKFQINDSDVDTANDWHNILHDGMGVSDFPTALTGRLVPVLDNVAANRTNEYLQGDGTWATKNWLTSSDITGKAEQSDVDAIRQVPDTTNVTDNHVLTKTSSGYGWEAVPKELPTGGSGSNNYLKLSVAQNNARTIEWATFPTIVGVPAGGSEGEVLGRGQNNTLEWVPRARAGSTTTVQFNGNLTTSIFTLSSTATTGTDAKIVVNRGTAQNADRYIEWNESAGYFTLSNNGSAAHKILTTDDTIDISKIPNTIARQSAVTSLTTTVNAKIGLPTGGDNNDYLKKTSSGYAWQAPDWLTSTSNLAAGKITGTLGIGHGGTGATTKTGVKQALDLEDSDINALIDGRVPQNRVLPVLTGGTHGQILALKVANSTRSTEWVNAPSSNDSRLPSPADDQFLVGTASSGWENQTVSTVKSNLGITALEGVVPVPDFALRTAYKVGQQVYDTEDKNVYRCHTAVLSTNTVRPHDDTSETNWRIVSKPGFYSGADTAKSTPVVGDVLSIQDSADSNNPKEITIGAALKLVSGADFGIPSSGTDAAALTKLTFNRLRVGTEFPNDAVCNAGDILASGELVSSLSDQRLKTEIETIDGASDKVMQLKGVIYEHNDKALELGAGKAGIRQAGLYAQDVEAVLPEAVRDSAYEGYKTLVYERVVPLLVEALKEQINRNNEQDERMDALEARLAALEDERGGES